MSEQNKVKQSQKSDIPDAVKKTDWGEGSNDNFGYKTDQERRDKRGLEDWEMVSSMEKSEVSIPYWFIALFVVLLVVAVGLTFPFWGNRPGYERPWYDDGIPLGIAWVVGMSVIIYYFVDLRHILEKKKMEKLKQAKGNSNIEESEKK